ncbi:MAG TPA: hypothetical protein VE961_20715 [Pyrinomonadaceae bacterium]|nr:hypothetical protein [Pyrinomonadaceae bacterium]
MLELYFIFYRIPKTMTRLARERDRSAVTWTIIAIASWIGAELLVGLIVGMVHGVGIALWGWQRDAPAIRILTYVLALVAALVSLTIVTQVLTRQPVPQSFPAPPPPPAFDDSPPHNPA